MNYQRLAPRHPPSPTSDTPMRFATPAATNSAPAAWPSGWTIHAKAAMQGQEHRQAIDTREKDAGRAVAVLLRRGIRR